MGLLDDAIREHLELKRRHGADPGDVARAEQEALGPVRRQPIERDDEFGDRVAHEERELAYDHADLIEPDDRAGSVEPDNGARLRDDDRLVALRETEGRAGMSEAEDEEYYDEEYYDEEEEEWEEPVAEGAFQDPAHDSSELPPESADPSRTPSTGSHHTRVPPESAPPTQATPPESDVDERDEQTAEYSVEEVLHSRPRDAEAEREDARPEGEDVLEETPEFLQDAPEHDRLWFEQRPPREFDFDD